MRIHHICIVVQNIEDSSKRYKSTYGLKQTSQIIIDPIQKVKILFLKNPNENIEYELVEPLDQNSPIYQSAKSKNSLNHICYEVESIDSKIQQLQKCGNLLISGPVEATAFNNRRIAFLYTPEHMIIELLESGNKDLE